MFIYYLIGGLALLLMFISVYYIGRYQGYKFGFEDGIDARFDRDI